MKLSDYNDNFTFKNKLKRFYWQIVDKILFKPFFLPYFRKWRIFILKSFGADVKWSVNIYSSVRIWAPWNLKMGNYSSLGPSVDCYNQGFITIGDNVSISQKTYLCASTHNITDVKHPLIMKSIIINDKVWVAADAFIGPGVTIGEGAVVGARAAVFKNVEPWTVVGGNPARFIKKREIVS